jgi:putative DNA primase/helicase
MIDSASADVKMSSKEFARTSLRKGFLPIQCRGKIPCDEGWRASGYRPTEAEIDTWREDCNGGVRLGVQPDVSQLIAIDSDTTDAFFATFVRSCDVIRKYIDRGAVPRHSGGNKFAIPVRLPASDTPLTKRVSPQYLEPTKHKEYLALVEQQSTVTAGLQARIRELETPIEVEVEAWCPAFDPDEKYPDEAPIPKSDPRWREYEEQLAEYEANPTVKRMRRPCDLSEENREELRRLKKRLKDEKDVVGAFVKKNKQQIEILAEGQQAIFYGIHPESKRRYQGGEAILNGVVDGKPEDIDALLAQVAEWADLMGYVPITRVSSFAGSGGGGEAAPGDPNGWCASALDYLDNDLDWDGWNRLGLALAHGFAHDPETGRELFHRFSAKSWKYDCDETDEMWDGLKPNGSRGIGSIIWEAKQRGWVPPPPPRPERDPTADFDPLNIPPPSLLTELDVAKYFVDSNRHRFRFDHTHGAWFVWAGSHWRRDDTKVVLRWACDLIEELTKDDTEGKLKSAKRRKSFAMGVEGVAQTDQSVAMTSDKWDPDEFLLGTPGGVVDLRTGVLSPAEPKHLITRRTAVAPADAAHCPRWQQFLMETFNGDEAVIAFVQRWTGYCLTGSTREQKLVFGRGDGGNGKGVLLNTTSGILHDYAKTAAPGVFAEAKFDAHPTELAMLQGARFVASSETEDGRQWAEARIKSLTGGDPITARFMRQDHFTFRPQFKIAVIGNSQPGLRQVSDAMTRRLLVVPFDCKPDNVDLDLEEHLKAEWSGILRWAIDGCLLWWDSGLCVPPAIHAATAEYFDSQDTFKEWFEEKCEVGGGDGSFLSADELNRSYGRFCEDRAEKPMTRTSLGRKLGKTLKQKTFRGVRGYSGVSWTVSDASL